MTPPIVSRGRRGSIDGWQRRRGAAGEFGEGLPGLWGTAGDSHLVQLPGTGYESRGRRLYGGDGKLKKGLEDLDVDDKDPGPGGGRPEDIRFVFKGGRPGGVAFWVRYVGPEPPYRAVPGKFPAQGRMKDNQ